MVELRNRTLNNPLKNSRKRKDSKMDKRCAAEPSPITKKSKVDDKWEAARKVMTRNKSSVSVIGWLDKAK